MATVVIALPGYRRGSHSRAPWRTMHSGTVEPVRDLTARRLRILTVVLAIACGLTVANLYYAQPLLDLIARGFHVGQGTATVVVTMTQIGYALGLLFVLPAGDLLENRVL